MRITVLIENSPGPREDVKPEFGLSLFIETSETKILMDTGGSALFADNARALGIDLAAVDWLVLSHGHYDHAGGLAKFFEINSRAKAVLRRGADRSFYASMIPTWPAVLHHAAPWTRYIGQDNKVLERFAERIHWIDDDYELSAGVRVLTRIPRHHALAKGNRFLLVKRGGDFIPDDFSHELLLVVEQRAEIVVFSGCAHNGILNMLAAAKRDKPLRRISAVVGGFHLNRPRSEKMSASEGEILQLARVLGQQVSGLIYTGHCTGAEAFAVMKPELGSRLCALHTGEQFEV